MLNKFNEIKKEVRKANKEASNYAINFIAKKILKDLKENKKTFAGYEVIKETQKAFLVKLNEKVNTWLPKSALKKDGSLKKVFAEKIEIELMENFIDLSDVRKETEKAIFVTVACEDFDGGLKCESVWIPKKCVAGQDLFKVEFSKVSWIFDNKDLNPIF